MNTYAIIAADGRQYKVEEGQEIQVDFRDEIEGGATITCLMRGRLVMSTVAAAA